MRVLDEISCISPALVCEDDIVRTLRLSLREATRDPSLLETLQNLSLREGAFVWWIRRAEVPDFEVEVFLLENASGVAMVRKGPTPEAFLFGVFVAPAFRGRGLGRRLWGEAYREFGSRLYVNPGTEEGRLFFRSVRAPGYDYE